MTARTLLDLLKATYAEWSEDNASRLAAALAYYTIFALAPLLLIAIAVAGFAFGDAAARGQVIGQLQGTVGPKAAATIQTAIQSTGASGGGALSAVVGVVTLLLGASGVFGELQGALNTIWGVQPRPGGGILATAKRKFLSMTMVLGIGFLLLVSLVLGAAVSAAGQLLGDRLPGGELPWQAVNFALSFGVITLLFAAIYKVLPDAEIRWRDVWLGAAATALLFTIGKLLLGLYLGHAGVGSTYGAAGSLLVVLVWVYYSAQILLFGAELTQVYARTHGARIVPSKDAMALTEAARARQGIPHRTGAPRAARGARTANATLFGRNPQEIKALLWAGLVAATLGLAGVLARLGSAAIWRAIVHEPPPTTKV